MSNIRWWLAIVVLGLVIGSCPVKAESRKEIVLNFDGATADTTAPGMADSTQVFFTRPFQKGFLRLHPDRACRVAIMVTSHGVSDTANASLGDSVNTSVWPWRNFSVAADSIAGYRETQGATSVQAASYELAWEFPAAAAGKWGVSLARYIELRGTDGAWYWGRNTRVRVRVLSAAGVVTWLNSRYEGVAW